MWIRTRARLAALAIAMTLAPVVAADAPDRDLPAYSRNYDVGRDPAADARAAFALAAVSGRRVLIEVGGEWCRWCHVLDRLLEREPALAARVHASFVVLKVAIDDDHDGATALARYPAADGYPYLYVTRADGALLHAQDATAFVDAGDYSAPHVHAFIARWSADGD